MKWPLVILLGAMVWQTAMPAFAQNADPAVEALAERARQWQERGREGLAIETWQRVLALDANNEEALARLTLLYAQTGQQAESDRLRARLETLYPASRYLDAAASERARKRARADALSRARDAARAGRYEAAAAAYLEAFPEPPSEDALKIEYYQGLAGDPQHRGRAIKALREMAKQQPDNLSLRMSLARLETYEPRWRREGIRELLDLADTSLKGEALQSNTRQGLMWLELEPSDAALLQRYLSIWPADTAVRDKLNSLDTLKQRQRVAEIDRATREGYALLEAGKSQQARDYFETLAQRYPDSGIPLAGLGMAELGLQQHELAAQHLQTAVERAPSRAAQWRPALREAQFYSRYSAAEQARSKQDQTTALRLYSEAFAAPPAEFDAALRVPYAAALRADGQLQAASIQLRQVLAVNPGQADASRMLAQILVEQGRLSEAESLVASGDEDLQAVLRPAQAAELRRRAANAVDAGALATAKADLQRAITLAPADPWLRLDLFRVNRRMGQDEQALELLTTLKRDAQRNPQSALAVAFMHAEMQNWLAVLKSLNGFPASAITPDARTLQRRAWIEYHIAKARAAYAAGLQDVADAAMSAAAREAGQERTYAASLAAGWADLGDPARAMAYMRRALDRRSPSVDEQLQYAGLLLSLDQGAEFEALANTLLSAPLSPGQAEQLETLVAGYRVSLADRARMRGDLAGAYDLLRDVIERRPDDAAVMQALARVFVDAGDAAAAQALFDKALLAAPDNSDALAGSIQAALLRGDESTAQRQLRQLQRQNANDPRYFALQGQLAERRGETGRALHFAELERAARQPQGASPAQQAPRLQMVESAAEPIADASAWLPPLRPRPSAFSAPKAAPGSPFANLAATSILRLDSGAARGGEDTGISRDVPGTALRLAPSLSPSFVVDTSQVSASDDDPLQQRIDRLRIQTTNQVQARLRARVREGEAGLSRLAETGVDFRYVGRARRAGQAFVSLSPVFLSAGDISGEQRERLGTLALIGGGDADTIGVSESGLGIALGYRLGELSASIGTTPLGFPEERLIGRVDWRPQGDIWQGHIGMGREPLTDSLLSYAGLRDELLGLNWGGMSRSALELGLTRDTREGGLYAELRMGQIDGRNVDENTTADFSGGVYLHNQLSPHAKVTYGFNVTALHFDKNQRHFSFGHGGYFSPQFFLAAVLPVELSGAWRDVNYRINTAVGFQTFREDGAAWFPSSAVLQDELDGLIVAEPALDLASGYSGGDTSGISYLVSAEIGRPISDNLALVGRFSLDNARDFREYNLTAGLRYLFSGGLSRRAAHTGGFQQGAAWAW